MAISRRGILIGSLAGGGLALGYMLRPRRFPLPLAPGKDETAFDAWIRIATTGMVTIAVPQLEMGQGITTLIPQIIAEEMGADWHLIAVEPAPASGAYANGPLAARWAPLWMPALPGIVRAPDSALARRWAQDRRFMATADGMSLTAYEAQARTAAASARAMLCMAAAARWDVEWQDCAAKDGFITHQDKRLGFGKLAGDAAGYTPPGTAPLRARPCAERAADFPAGTPPRYPRLDMPSKVDGSFAFAADVRLPGMVHAAIRHGPIGQSALHTFSPRAAPGESGPIGVVRGENWLAAAASTWWAAERALTAMAPKFSVKARAQSETIDAALDSALRKGDGVRLAELGDPDEVLGGKLSLALRYDVAPALHAGLETASATARLDGGRLELWVASQSPEALRRAAARALDMNERAVTLYPMAAGGSFDRRLEHEHAIEAALIARELGKPVQLTWSRWQEALAGLPRTPVSAFMAGKVGPEGEVLGWMARLALPASAREFGKRQFDGQHAWRAREAGGAGADVLAMEGAVPPYAVPNLLIEHVPVQIDLPTGRMRGNAHGYTCFFNECFVDELAHLGHHEPLSYRIAMLGGDTRLAECLQRAASLAMWNGGNDGSGQGIGCHCIQDGRIAVIATARRDENGVRVDRISAVADIGRIINLDIARQQIEGGLVFGIGLALGCSTPYLDGLPMSGRLGAMGLPLLADCPQIDVDFIDSSADPSDPGELGVAAVAPALANALFSATGVRFRKLPLLSEDI